jgi:hypothetical protein
VGDEPNAPPDSDARGARNGAATPRSLPSNKFRFGRLMLNRKQGTAMLPVHLPGGGSLSLSGKGIKPVGVQAAKAVVAKLAIRLTGRAKKVLVRTGRAGALARITLTPSGGAPGTESGCCD